MKQIFIKLCSFFKYIWRATKYIFLWKPVERDRLIFAHSGWGLIWYSILFTGIVVLSLSIISALGGFADDLYYSGKASTNLEQLDWLDNTWKHIWNVLCQFTDPGNIPQSNGLRGNLLALTIALLGIICFSGFCVTAFVSYISKQSELWKQGLLHYNFRFSKYVVIIGCNEQTANIVRRSLKRTINGNKVGYVLIQTRQNVDVARQKLELKLDKEEEEKIVFYSGERTSEEDIKVLHLEKALEVYILGEDMQKENEEDHDTYNINCLQLVSEYIDNKSLVVGKFRCHVNFEYQSTYTVFKSINIYKRLSDKIEFLPFNVHEIWAKKVLVDNYAVVPGKDGIKSVERYLPLDNYGIHYNSQRRVHLFILGMNQMGTALGIQAALLAHYPNFHRNHNLRTTITFIDDQAVKEGEFFRGRFAQLFSLCRYRTMVANEVSQRKSKKWITPMPDMGKPSQDFEYEHTCTDHNFLDVEWEFIQANVASEDVQNYMIEVANKLLDVDKEHCFDADKGNNYAMECTVAICFNNPQQSAATAVYLPEKLLKRVNQVLVYQKNKFELINMVSASEHEWKRYEKLRPFGMIEDCYTNNMFENISAQLVHRLYSKDDLIKADVVTYKQSTSTDKENTEVKNKTTLDFEIDEMKRHWDELDMSSKLANINMADSIGTKIRSLGIVKYEDIATLPFSAKARFIRIFSDGLRKDIEDALSGDVDSMTKIEHTRWLTERLIIGYRPVNKEELEKLNALRDDFVAFCNKKDSLKAKNRAHLDICSNAKLHSVDPYIRNKNNDEKVVTNIPYIIKTTGLILSRLALRENIEGYNNIYDEDELTRDVLLKMVSIDQIPFWICSETISVALWYRVMQGKGVEITDANKNLPKTEVSKEDAEDFIRILNDMTGLCFRLPTKNEWKEAAEYSEQKSTYIRQRGRTEPDIVNNDNYSGNNLYHMLGNVWEWTSDNLKENGKIERSFIYCGGSFMYGDDECNIEGNNWYNYGLSDFKSKDLGFRLILSHKFNLMKSKKEEPVTIPIHDIIDLVFGFGKEIMDDENIMLEIKTLTEEDCKHNHRFCQGTNNWLPEEQYAHFVKFKTSKMYIGRFPVTQKLWETVMCDNPSVVKNDNAPVTNVSYANVQDFLKRLNDELPKSSFYKNLPDEQKGWRFRLPTEAEWEYIAKGGATHYDRESKDCENVVNWSQKDSVFCTPENVSVDDVAWHYGITKSIHPVGSKMGRVVVDNKTIADKRKDLTIADADEEKKFMRQYMVFDMCGNVWEWCIDDFDADAYKKYIDDNGKICDVPDKDNCENQIYNEPHYAGIFYNYEEEKNGYVHSARGGSWKCLAEECRVTRVNRYLTSYKSDDLGFRLVFADVSFIDDVKKQNKKK